MFGMQRKTIRRSAASSVRGRKEVRLQMSAYLYVYYWLCSPWAAFLPSTEAVSTLDTKQCRLAWIPELFANNSGMKILRSAHVYHRWRQTVQLSDRGRSKTWSQCAVLRCLLIVGSSEKYGQTDEQTYRMTEAWPLQCYRVQNNSSPTQTYGTK